MNDLIVVRIKKIKQLQILSKQMSWIIKQKLEKVIVSVNIPCLLLFQEIYTRKI